MYPTQLNYTYYRCKGKKRDRIKNKINKLKKQANNTYSNHASLTRNHMRNGRKSKYMLQNNIRYDRNDIIYKTYSKPKQFESNLKAYKTGFVDGYKKGFYDGHCNIYKQQNIYQDDSYDIGKLHGYNMGYKDGIDCKQCNNKYHFDGYEQNMIGLHWHFGRNDNNGEHINLIKLKWSDNYGYYSYDSFGWTLYTELTNKNDPIYHGITKNIKAKLNKKINIPIYQIQIKAHCKNNTKKTYNNNNYLKLNKNRIYIGYKQYIDKYSKTFLKWIQPTDIINGFGRNYSYHSYTMSYFYGYSWCLCTENHIYDYHLCECDRKILANKLSIKYKNICSDVLTTIVPDVQQTRIEVGYMMMHNTPLSNHGSDIVNIVLNFVFPRKIIDFYYQIERNKDLCTKMNGDNFINSFKKLNKKSDKQTMLKTVNIYDELEKYINDNGNIETVKYLNTMNAKNIINNVKKYGVKYYEKELRQKALLDFQHHRYDDWFTYNSNNTTDSEESDDYDKDITNINCISYTKLKIEQQTKNKYDSLYVKKKYRKNDKRVFTKKKNKKIRGKDKKEINYKRRNKMRKHKNDTKNRFNLQYYLRMCNV